MNIYHARYFVDAAREGSVSRAAERNGVTHSAVSQAIRSLESHFGVGLLDHAKRRFELTDAGRTCFEELGALLAAHESARQRIAESDGVVRGELSLMAPQSLYIRALYGALGAFREKYPRVRLELQTGAAALVRSGVAEGRAQIGILVDDGFTDRFSSKVLRAGEFRLVGPRPREKVGARDLIVTSKEKVETLHLRKRLPAPLRAKWADALEVVSWTVIRRLAEHGLGHGYVPDYVVEDDLRAKRLYAVEAPGRPFRYEIRAIWAAGREPHANARRFLDLLKL